MRVRCCYLAPSIPPIRKPRQIYDVKAFYTHFLPSSFLFLVSYPGECWRKRTTIAKESTPPLQFFEEKKLVISKRDLPPKVGCVARATIAAALDATLKRVVRRYWRRLRCHLYSMDGWMKGNRKKKRKTSLPIHIYIWLSQRIICDITHKKTAERVGDLWGLKRWEKKKKRRNHLPAKNKMLIIQKEFLWTCWHMNAALWWLASSNPYDDDDDNPETKKKKTYRNIIAVDWPCKPLRFFFPFLFVERTFSHRIQNGVPVLLLFIFLHII